MRYLMLLLVIISILGYCAAMKKRWNVRIEFSPAIVSSGIVGILFVAGILNMMKIIVYLVFIIGIVLFVLECKCLLEQRTLIVLCVLLSVMVYFAFLLKGSVITSYDNFSHWLTVVKSMLLTDRMPNFKDTMIVFQSYPLGSGLWLYYFGKLCSLTEGMLLFAQVTLMLFMVLPMFAFVKKENKFSNIVIVVYIIFLLTINNGVHVLTVDTLLAAVGVGCLAIIGYEKKNCERALLEIMPLLILEVQIKNSGIFFVLVCILYYILVNKQEIIKNKTMRYKFIGDDIVLPIFSMFVWKQHVKLVFEDGEHAKHSMSVANYKTVLGDKTNEIIIQIAKDVFRGATTISTTERVAMLMMLIFSVIILAIVIASFKKKQVVYRGIKMIAAIWLIYSIYIFFVFCMYVFSMTYNEYLSTDLPSFNRYAATCLGFIGGLIVLYIIDSDSGLQHQIVPISLLVTMFVLFGKTKDELLPMYENTSTNRVELQKMLLDYGVPQGASCTIYAGDSIGGYLYYYCRYELWSSNVVLVRKSEGFDSLSAAAEQSEYLVIWNSSADMNKYLKTIGKNELKGKKRVILHKTE